MAYLEFRQIDEEPRADKKIDLYDEDGFTVNEIPDGSPLRGIVASNDVAALRLYQDSLQRRGLFWQKYELSFYHPFFTAEANGSFDVLRVLLEIYLADTRYTEPLDQYLKRLKSSPIKVACAAAQRELTLWLLNHTPLMTTLNDRDVLGQTPLYSAADVSPSESMNKHEDFPCFLLEQGCSVQDSNIYVEQSIEEKENSNLRPELKGTVLGVAVPYASSKMVSRLIAEGAQVHARQNWTDKKAWNRPDRIQNAERVTALHIASFFGNLQAIHTLMDHHGDISVAAMVFNTDEYGRIPLHWALLGVLDSPRSRTDQNEQYPSLPHRMDTAKLLLEANPDTINTQDKQGGSALNYVVKSDTKLSSILSVVKMLLDAKPSMSTLATALEDTVRYHARRFGRALDPLFTELIEILLENGSSTHLCLHRLCDGNWTDHISPTMIDRLLESSDVNDTDSAGCTAMHYLVQYLDQIDAVRQLIDRGANVNVVDHKGNTPLHLVMRSTMFRKTDENGTPDPSQPWNHIYIVREEVVKMLVDAGGLMDQPNEAGETPTQLLAGVRERWRKAEQSREAGKPRWPVGDKIKV